MSVKFSKRCLEVPPLTKAEGLIELIIFLTIIISVILIKGC